MAFERAAMKALSILPRHTAKLAETTKGPATNGTAPPLSIKAQISYVPSNAPQRVPGPLREARRNRIPRTTHGFPRCVKIRVHK